MEQTLGVEAEEDSKVVVGRFVLRVPDVEAHQREFHKALAAVHLETDGEEEWAMN